MDEQTSRLVAKEAKLTRPSCGPGHRGVDIDRTATRPRQRRTRSRLAAAGGRWIGRILAWTSVLLLAVAAVPGSAQVPSSSRSRQAIERARPALERDLAAAGLRLGAGLFLRIFKETSELEVWLQGRDARFQRFRTYPVCSFSGELGPKLQEGDGQAPEGFYWVGPRQMNPHSRFHLSFDLGYPNAYDRAHGRTGSALMVHGSCVSVGCYAMTDPGIEEIYALADAALRGGQPFFRVHVFPFPLTDEELQQRASSPWLDFWRNLQEGYTWFERERRPPDVKVEGGRYAFRSQP
jgi:murein L,D-transpeptidase YafK